MKVYFEPADLESELKDDLKKKLTEIGDALIESAKKMEKKPSEMSCEIHMGASKMLKSLDKAQQTVKIAYNLFLTGDIDDN